MYDGSYPPQPSDIVDLTGITDEVLKQGGIPPQSGLRTLQEMMHKADYVLAHNKKFDQRLHHDFSIRHNIPVVGTQWLCSLTEAEWPKQISCRKLSHIALELHPELLFSNGKKIEFHRAMNDVELMLNLVGRTFDWEKFVAYAVQPWVTLQVKIPAPWVDNGVGKDWAKKNGYGWESPPGSDLKFEKSWVKRVKESKVSGEQNGKPYEIKCL